MTKTALITTTINIPTVLALYRKLDPYVRFFVAGDSKTQNGAEEFCTSLGNCLYLPPRDQEKWKVSQHLGWNTDSRRNIAVLEALAWGADLLISVDDDMIPYPGFFWHFQRLFSAPYSGLQFGAPGYWFDAGKYMQPPAKQRGLPLEYDFVSTAGFVHDAQIGAAQGTILGIPDTDALTAITNEPRIHSATDALQQGFVVHPGTHSVFNSQVTSFRRELAPAFAQFYKWQGRNTDIIASLMVRRLMKERNLYTHFGQPLAFHARKQRGLFKDLQAEMFGLEHVDELAERLSAVVLAPVEKNMIEQTKNLYKAFVPPSEQLDAVMAWLQDCEVVL